MPQPGRDAHLKPITLYRSHLGSGGARYEPLERVQLGARGGGVAGVESSQR